MSITANEETTNNEETNNEETTPAETAAPARVRRSFSFNGTTLADPDPAKTPDDVRKHFAANGFPTLTSGTVTGPEVRDGKQVYTLKASVGTKG